MYSWSLPFLLLVGACPSYTNGLLQQQPREHQRLFHQSLFQQQHGTSSSSLKTTSKDSNSKSNLGHNHGHVISSRARDDLITQACKSSSRRAIIIASMLLSTSTFAKQPPVAHAAYGTSASIELPSVLDYLIERDEATRIDKNSEAVLYQGADRKVLLQRLQVAAQRISEIPSIAQQNKWSQINGILTGPLGELIVTMRQVMAGSSGATEKEKQLLSAMKSVQADLYQIGAAASKKSYDGCYDGTGKKKVIYDTTSR